MVQEEDEEEEPTEATEAARRRSPLSSSMLLAALLLTMVSSMLLVSTFLPFHSFISVKLTIDKLARFDGSGGSSSSFSDIIIVCMDR